MKVLRYRDYPENYDWLPQEKQQILIEYFNKEQSKIIKMRIQKYSNRIYLEDFALRQDLDDYIGFLQSCLYAARDTLQEIGICMEYSWIGDRDKWILVDLDRALFEEECIKSMEEF